MRKEYELTDGQLADLMPDGQLADLMQVSEPHIAIALNCGPLPNQQERANNFWQKLSEELGFDYMTARPVPGKGPRFFTAEEVINP